MLLHAWNYKKIIIFIVFNTISEYLKLRFYYNIIFIYTYTHDTHINISVIYIY